MDELQRIRSALKDRAGALIEQVSALHPPNPDSLLARTDQVGFPRMPPSSIVHNALISAVCHLEAMDPFLATGNANRLTAWSVLRPALMATSEAGWVLTGQNHREQARRSAILAKDFLRYEIRFLETADRLDGADATERLAWRRRVQDDLHEWCSGADVGPEKFDMTKALQETAKVVLPGRELNLEILWKELSAAAHGYGWHVQTRTFGAGTQPIDGSNLVRFSLELNLSEYLNNLAEVTEYAEIVTQIADQLSGTMK